MGFYVYVDQPDLVPSRSFVSPLYKRQLGTLPRQRGVGESLASSYPQQSVVRVKLYTLSGWLIAE